MNDEEEEEIIEVCNPEAPPITRLEAEDGFEKVRRYIKTNTGSFFIDFKD